jgi:hypothetical protein
LKKALSTTGSDFGRERKYTAHIALDVDPV